MEIRHAEPRDLPKITALFNYYIEHTNNSLSKIREALFAFYEGALPACSLVEVSALISKELHVEIEAIIALNSNE